MKRLIASVVLLCLLLTGCGGGDIAHVQVEIGASAFFTREEIEDAMDVALGYFDREFEGCTMTEMVYDESLSWVPSIRWAEQYGAEEAIILLSVFRVAESGADGSLNPGDTYTGWQWILTRNEGEEWVLCTWGYG